LTAVGAAYAAAFTLTTTKLGAASVTTPIMFPDQITIVNGTGAGHVVGRADNGDIITLVFSRLLQASTICSSWTNTGPNSAVSLQWSVTNGTGGANDSLVADGTSASCIGGLKIGTIDLGAAGYDTATAAINFQTTSTSIAFGTSTTTITATLNGRKNGTQGTVASGSAATWTPNAAVTDRSSNNSGSNIAKTSATVQF
jgi:hypothetical protein